MKIIDTNGTERNIESIKKMTHKIPKLEKNKEGDMVNKGKMIEKEFAEVAIKGKSGRVWIEWYPLEQFKKYNPGVQI